MAKTAPIEKYAIIALGGKQYRVREGERLLVDRLATAEGKTFHPEILLLGGDGKTVLNSKTTVTVKVLGHVLGKKVRIGKYRPKSGYKRHTGFRASLSQIEIESIGARRAAAASAPKAEEKPRDPKPAARTAKEAEAAPKKTETKKPAAAKPAARTKAETA